MAFNPTTKVNINEKKKIEAMLEVIHKATSKESSAHWRKHTPVYGWVQMNYPTAIQPPLLGKYEKQREQFENVHYENTAPTASSVVVTSQEAKVDEDSDDETKWYCPGNKFRLDPEKVNENILKESIYNS
jgi:hypothetical protein